MNEIESPRQTALRVCVGIFLLILLYPLSAGPVVYYVQRHHTPRNIAIGAAVYRPLLENPVFRKYTKFWADLAFRP